MTTYLSFIMTRTDARLFLFFFGFTGSFYLGVWLCYTGVRRIINHRFTGNSGLLIVIGIGLFLLSSLSFLDWYRQIKGK
jgi:membrane-bound ClpP family serine protease